MKNVYTEGKYNEAKHVIKSSYRQHHCQLQCRITVRVKNKQQKLNQIEKFYHKLRILCTHICTQIRASGIKFK